MKAGITTAAIHGNKSQGARTKALEGFRAGKIRALVATDLAARGIDVDGITHVINYHLPIESEVYIHRIGRTARAGLDGDAVSLCSANERDQLRDIERLIRKTIPVDKDHSYHSETAANAVGAAAKPEPKGKRGPRKQFNRRSSSHAPASRPAPAASRNFRPKRPPARKMRSGAR
jgi:ATP-dependent RNA helicase RhlE